MRTTNKAARGGPLAALLVLLVLTMGLSVVAAERIRVEQSLEWAALEEGASGLPQQVDLTLLLQGIGPAGGYPIDCVIIMDTSASADLSSAKSFALDLINQFGPNDRIGLVTYANAARLVLPMTENRLVLRTAIGDLRSEGKSALGDAMQMARRELTLVGREDAVLVEILLSDGQNNVGIDPTVEGRIAADSGIQIVSVGIGPVINRALLESFANETGGLFFARPSSPALAEIASHLDVDTVASEILIVKELPKGLRLISSSPRAYRTETNASGTMSAIWRVSELRIEQQVVITMVIEAAEIGAWSDDLDVLVTYTNFRGVQSSELSPPPNWPPVALFEYEPLAPTTSEIIAFTDKSKDTNKDGRIVRWEWRFGDVAVSSLQNPEFRFAERGTYVVRLIVMDDRGSTSMAYEQEITVGNAAPVAGFVLRDPESMAEVARPHLGVTTMLDASMSYDLDGDIALYRWDLDGDGIVDLESGSSDVAYAFKEPGKIAVSLTVVDDEGKTETSTKTVDILPSVLALRAIETCMPDDVTIAAGVVSVSIVLSVNTQLNGLSVSETIPAGWTFAEVDNDGATLRHNGQTLEWLFFERFLDDGINAQREIRYTLTAPATLADALVQANVRGTVGCSSPRVSLTVSGDDRVTATKILPVPVVISRWDTAAMVLDPCLMETIAFDQIQYAVSLWLSEGEVPNTGGAKIDLQMMQDLIAYWLTGSSVHDPLP